MKRSGNFVLQRVAGEAILVPVGDTVVELNGLVTLNGSGLFLWSELETDRSQPELVDLLLAEFEVAPDQARADVAAFVEQLTALRAIEP